MYKKLIAINSAVVLLLAAVYVLGYYVMNYPMRFDLWYLLKECQLQYLIAVLCITALASYLISSLDFKKLNFKSKFLSVFPVVNILAVAFFVYIAADGFIKNKRKLTNQENYYIREAKKDIQKDQIMMRYTGGFSVSGYDQKTLSRIDSVTRKYGIISQNTGCTVDMTDIKAQEKYDEITNPYLEKRNGKGWKERMKKEIDDVKKTKNQGTE
ncbi:hypothetical protein ACM46_18890 [Chryseobacterium angstadtii]|uniref:Uncharacterized protein n=1 Tax=Chryseobacterium angstadtii TaxID=558151 RepID=A0A0J7I1H9_9FLAO|nr:hypothetical protein [Chryseobacterium angstadtii]KMQ60273.1 hypothetical protein ACM46_18890 [Chryseobacterium angstadtii]